MAGIPNKITIIGSGLGGCFLALLLAKRGYQVDIYEKLSKKETAAMNAKRSFSLALYGYAVDILKENGLWRYVKPCMLPLAGSYTQVTKESKPIHTSFNQEKVPYYIVTRADLLNVLLHQTEKKANIKLHYGKEIMTIDRYERSMLIRDKKTRKISVIKTDVIIGADGVHSVVRQYIQQGQNISHSQIFADFTYKQFSLSKEAVEKIHLEKNAAYTWSRKNAFIASFPNKDGSHAALLILPKGDYGFSSLDTQKKIELLFKNEFPMLLPIVPTIKKSLIENPEGNFVTIHTAPWYYKDFMAIIGDAAHGMYPFFGQGVSAAMGDCLQLVKLLDIYGPQWKIIFPLYQEARKENMDALGEISKMQLFRYLRNKRADYNAVYDKLEDLAHAIFPKIFNAPLSEKVLNQPERTALHLEKYTKQRKRARYFGVPLAVAMITRIVALQESGVRQMKLGL